jgi:hypothetical protein
LDQSELTLSGHAESVSCAAFRPDGGQIATVGGFIPTADYGGRGEVILWDATTGQRQHVLRGETSRALGAAYSPDGKWLATINMKAMREAKEQVPELGMSFDLLRSALDQPTLTFAQALHLTHHHIRRNETAHKSHRKTWLAKHKRLTTKLML